MKGKLFNALSTKSIKENILKVMADEDGCIKICTIIHFKLSEAVKVYIHERGQAGRDGRSSNCIILWKALMLVHVKKEITAYAREKCDCRCQDLMSFFESSCQGQSNCEKCVLSLNIRLYPQAPDSTRSTFTVEKESYHLQENMYRTD